MVGTIGAGALVLDGDGVILGFGTTGVMADIMVGAGIILGDGTDGAGEATMDTDTDGADIITHGITPIMVMVMVMEITVDMADMVTTTITRITEVEEAITTTIPLPAIALQEI